MSNIKYINVLNFDILLFFNIIIKLKENTINKIYKRKIMTINFNHFIYKIILLKK